MDLLSHSSARFVLVGSLSAAGYFALCFVAQSAFGWPPFWASLVAYGLAFILTYLAHKYWAFRSRTAHGVTLLRYGALQAALALGIAGVTQFLATNFGFPALVNSAASALLAAGISYFVSGNWVFRDG
jgi:putative flippase GtrA